METLRELALSFVNLRREHPYIRFDKEIATKIKNDIFVLSYLKRHEAVHPKQLSEEFMISTAQMAVILNHLEERGLVIRHHDPQSSRQTIVRLTEAGAEYYDSVNSEIIAFTARLFSHIGEEDARNFIRITRRLMQATDAEESSAKAALSPEKQPEQA